MTYCEHDWDYTGNNNSECDKATTTYYRGVVCQHCGKQGREVYTFERTEEFEE